MILTLSDDLRVALETHPDSLVALKDKDTDKLYVVVPREEYERLADEHLRRELQIAFDQVDRGEVAPWDSESIKAEGRAELARRRAGQA